MNEVFDNKKATHREVAAFVQNALKRTLEPLAIKIDQQNGALDALYLYLAEVGICGVKFTAEDVANHYKKRAQEEREKQKERYEAAKKAAEEKEQSKEQSPECSSAPSPVSS